MRKNPFLLLPSPLPTYALRVSCKHSRYPYSLDSALENILWNRNFAPFPGFVCTQVTMLRVDSMEGGGEKAPGGRICRTGKKRGKYGTRLFAAKCFQSNVHFLNKLCQEGLSGAWAQCKHRLPSYSFFLLPSHHPWRGKGTSKTKGGPFPFFSRQLFHYAAEYELL